MMKHTAGCRRAAGYRPESAKGNRPVKRFAALLFALAVLAACTAGEKKNPETGMAETAEPAAESGTQAGTGMPAESALPARVFEAPASIPAEIIAGINRSKPDFLADLHTLLASEQEDLFRLVDKSHSLPADFVPPGLVSLTETVAEGRSYRINRADLSLRRSAEQALEEMSAAARADGVTVLVSSTYRSYEYQDGLYKRNVAQLGQEAADRESARPGTSQHQFGTAVDFGSITDDFAQTEAGIWLARHAGDFGWSLSYPDGYEDVTGYRWECWHYRYLSVAAVQMQQKWFGGIQQYMLEFIHAWKEFQGLP